MTFIKYTLLQYNAAKGESTEFLCLSVAKLNFLVLTKMARNDKF